MLEDADRIPSSPALLEIDPPNGRIVGFYGMRDVRAGMGAARLAALRAGIPIRQYTMEVEVDEIAKGKIGVEDLAHIRFLPLWWTKRALRDHIGDILAGTDPARKTLPPMELLERDPQLLEVLWQHPECAHLKVVAWLCDCPAKVGRVAAIRSRKDIARLRIGK